ncbi:MAG: hypothetical protein CMH57_01055 [Myxococcales bacterium]|nr:hypothetical protein [Myxococcales bacterium]
MSDERSIEHVFLIIDDDPMITRLCTRILKRLGLSLKANTMHTALQQFQLNQDRLSVVLLDLNLGHEDGLSVFEACTEINPDVPFVVMSGYSEESMREHFAADNLTQPSAFLSKPFTPTAMLELLEALLDA